MSLYFIVVFVFIVGAVGALWCVPVGVACGVCVGFARLCVFGMIELVVGIWYLFVCVWYACLVVV